MAGIHNILVGNGGGDPRYFNGKGFYPPGQTPNNSATSVIASINFANDTVNTPITFIASANWRAWSAVQTIKGYIHNGSDINIESPVTPLRRQDLLTNSISMVSSTYFPIGRVAGTALNSPTNGYIILGYTCYYTVPGGDSCNFATEARTAMAETANYLNLARFEEGGNSDTNGYVRGSGDLRNNFGNVCRYNFATNTSTPLSTAMRSNQWGVHAYDWAGYNSKTAFYSGGGGQNLLGYANVDYMPFATETVGYNIASFPSTRAFHSCTNSVAKGYSAGGYNNGFNIGAMFTDCQAHDFATNTMATISAVFAISTITMRHGYQSGGML
jgi:hypothetical protein